MRDGRIWRAPAQFGVSASCVRRVRQLMSRSGELGRQLDGLAEDVGPDVWPVRCTRAFPGIGDGTDDAVAEGLTRHAQLAAAASGRGRPVVFGVHVDAE